MQRFRPDIIEECTRSGLDPLLSWAIVADAALFSVKRDEMTARTIALQCKRMGAIEIRVLDTASVVRQEA